MGKGDNRKSNKEVKKPKKDKPKSPFADSGSIRAPLVVAGKKVK